MQMLANQRQQSAHDAQAQAEAFKAQIAALQSLNANVSSVKDTVQLHCNANASVTQAEHACTRGMLTPSSARASPASLPSAPSAAAAASARRAAPLSPIEGTPHGKRHKARGGESNPRPASSLLNACLPPRRPTPRLPRLLRRARCRRL